MNSLEVVVPGSSVERGLGGARAFGLSQVQLSPLGFGAAPIGNLYASVSEAQAQSALAAAARLGIGYIDTAPHYGFGLSETRLGQFLSARAHSPVLSTKVGRLLVPTEATQKVRHGFVDTPALEPQFDYSYEGVMRSFESSLARLGRDSVDILFAHDLGKLTHGDQHPQLFKTFMEGGYKAMAQLKAEGRVKAIGLGANEWQICEQAMDHGDFDGFLLAGRYSLLEQGALETFFPRCAAQGASVIIGGPFNSGILASGVKGPGPKYYNYEPAPADIEARVAQLEAVCDEFALPLAAAALQFPLAHPQVVSVLAGFASSSQVEQAGAWMAQPIPDEFWQRLRELQLIHPHAPVACTPNK